MSIENRLWNWGFNVIVFLCTLLTSLLAFGQGACPGLAPADKDLYIMPNSVLQTFDFSANGIAFVHDYGHTRLAFFPDTGGIPEDILGRITRLSDLSTIHFRAWMGEFVTPQVVDLAGLKDGYHILAMFGPMESRQLEDLRGSGILVLGPLRPYGLLVKAESLR